MNGKLKVNLNRLENANVFVLLQPNRFNKDIKNTHGILENGMIYGVNEQNIL